MTKAIIRGVLAALALSLAGIGTASGQTLEVKELETRKRAVPTIGVVPPKRERAVDVGTLRLVEAELPQPPMTLQQRMMLRARKARERRRQVEGAVRSRPRMAAARSRPEVEGPKGGMAPPPPGENSAQMSPEERQLYGGDLPPSDG